MQHSNLYLISVVEAGFYFFHTCFRIRISSLFHLDTQTMPILNLNCLKNAYPDFLSSHLKCSLNCVVFASSVQTQSVICVGRHHYPRITPYLKWFWEGVWYLKQSTLVAIKTNFVKAFLVKISFQLSRENWEKIVCPRMRFLRFKAIKIQNGHCFSALVSR